MKQFAFISLLIILGGLGILFISLKPYQQPGCGVKDFEPFCGTANLSDGAYEGKQIFNANCAACHKLDKNMTGPALRGMAQRYDSVTLVKFIHGEKTLIESKGYNTICIKFPQLTAQDILNLIKYTE